jgi:hypothetical protein
MAMAPLPTTDYWIPTFTLYDATGETLVWTFFATDETDLPQTPVETVIITNFRASGAVVINGGQKSFETTLHFYIVGSGYKDVDHQLKELVAAIPVNVPFILKVGVSQDSAPDVYNVKRIVDFTWSNVQRDLRNYRQEITVKFLVNAF